MSLNTNTTVYGVVAVPEITKRVAANVEKTYGLAYPLTENIGAGYFNKASGKELVENNLKQLLTTALGERILLPDFGIDLKKYIFEPADEQTFVAIQHDIVRTISKYAKGVKVLRLRIFPLDEYGPGGSHALSIQLTVQILDDVNNTFEVGVKIG